MRLSRLAKSGSLCINSLVGTVPPSSCPRVFTVHLGDKITSV